MRPAENRPLEGLEALFACYHERLGDLTTCSATRIEGVLLPAHDDDDATAQDRTCLEERAKDVVKSLVRAHPLLRSTVRLEQSSCNADDQRNPALRRKLVPLNDESLWPTLRIEYENELTRTTDEVENEEETGWQYSLRREHDHRFVHDEALIRYLLHFPSDHSHNGCAYLILAAHHGLLDGRSLAIVAKDFVEGLKRSVVKPDANEHVTPSLQRSSSLVDLIGDNFPSAMNNAKESTDEQPPAVPFPDANKTYAFDHTAKLSEPSVVRYLYRQLSEDSITKLAARCRKDGIRLTSAIIAAITGQGLGRHLQRPDVKDSIGFQCCVDLRRYIKDDEDEVKDARSRALGNLYSIADLKVPVPDECSSKCQMDKGRDAAESILNRVPMIQQELEMQLSDRRLLAGVHSADVDELALSAEDLCKKVEAEGYHGRDFFTGVSNLGKLDINGDDNGDTLNRQLVASEYWFMTRLARVGTFCFLSCSYIPGYGMCIVFTRPDPICSLTSAQGILDRTISALDAYAIS